MELLLIVFLVLITLVGITALIVETYNSFTSTRDEMVLFHTQVILAILQGGSLLYLIVYVVKTWEMASATRKSTETSEKVLQEMIEARDQETAPYIVVYFDLPPGSHIIFLVIKNIGKSVANNVRIDFTPFLQSSSFKNIHRNSLIVNGLKSMPPGYEVRTVVDDSVLYFKSEAPLIYNVKASYFGGIKSEVRIIEQTLDLSSYKDLTWPSKKGMEELITEIKNISRQQEKIARTLEKPSIILFRLKLWWINLSRRFPRRNR
jgi:hypothetical protein